jgi:hypothetical protein
LQAAGEAARAAAGLAGVRYGPTRFRSASAARMARDAPLIHAEDACEEEQADHEADELKLHHFVSVAGNCKTAIEQIDRIFRLG